MNIVIVGAGYVGYSLSLLLAQKNNVVVVDTNLEKVKRINNGQSAFRNNDIHKFLSNNDLLLNAVVDDNGIYNNSHILIITLPTNYSEKNECFDTIQIDRIIDRAIISNPDILIVIKSTLPIGYTRQIKKKTAYRKIIYNPEFLRESFALYDQLNPSRIIVGMDKDSNDYASEIYEYIKILKQCIQKPNVKTIIMGSSEAEAVKLFSNAYLAMRIAFFNELDSYAETNELESKDIIEGVSLDPRIGNYYNNPSFGYGGYCLTKDTKQLRGNFFNTPQKLISAIVESNDIRKDYIADRLIGFISHDYGNTKGITVGIYRINMKYESDNYRFSAVLDIMNKLKESGIEIIVYEPILYIQETIYGFNIIKDLDEFKSKSNIIIANRYYSELSDVIEKVYSRDLFNRD